MVHKEKFNDNKLLYINQDQLKSDNDTDDEM